MLELNVKMSIIQDTVAGPGTTICTMTTTGGTAPYVYSIFDDVSVRDTYAISGNKVVTTRAINVNEALNFAVHVVDQSDPQDSATSGLLMPIMQAAAQNMFNKTDVIYKITRDINLYGKALTIPANCTLDFQGGKFIDGYIVGNNTKIIAGINQIFDYVQISGTFDVDNSYPQWFGAKGDGLTDCTAAFQALNGRSIMVPNGTYIISNLSFGKGTTITGSSKLYTILQQKDGSSGDFITLQDWYAGTISNFTIKGGKNIVKVNFMQALLKLKVVDYDSNDKNSSYFSEIYNILIRDSQYSGISLLGSGEIDMGITCYPNWVFGLHDSYIIKCNEYGIYNSTSDNRFHDILVTNCGYSNIIEKGSSNIWNNIKLDGQSSWNKPSDMSVSDWVEQEDKCGTLIVNGSNINMSNIDVQSDSYLNVKISCTNSNLDIVSNNAGTISNDGIGFYIFSSVSSVLTLRSFLFKNERIPLKIKNPADIAYNIINFNANNFVSILAPTLVRKELITLIGNGNVVNSPLLTTCKLNEIQFNNEYFNYDLSDIEVISPQWGSSINTNNEFLTKNSINITPVEGHGAIKSRTDLGEIQVEEGCLYITLCAVKNLTGASTTNYFPRVILKSNALNKTVNILNATRNLQVDDVFLVPSFFTASSTEKVGVQLLSINATNNFYVSNIVVYNLTKTIGVNSIPDFDLNYVETTTKTPDFWATIISIIMQDSNFYENKQPFSDVKCVDKLFTYPLYDYTKMANLSPSIGRMVFEKPTNKPKWWDGSNWVNSDGYIYELPTKGTTAQRPALTADQIPFQYYDTDLKKFINWNGTAWVNMDGSALA